MTDEKPSRGAIVIAYAIVYIVWGSTYLALRYVVTDFPPFSSAGIRFLLAGALLYGYARFRGAPNPTKRQWLFAAAIGACLLLGGNGGVMWAEQRIPSSIAALLVAVEPLWIVLLQWLGPSKTRPTVRMVIGLAVGLAGVVILVGIPGEESANVDVLGAAAVIFGAFAWAVGSLWSSRLPADAVARSPVVASGAQMLTGGVMLSVLGLLTGESARWAAADITMKPVVGLLYLVVFGSIVAFSAYAWLLRVEPPARVATYAFVNPAVAMLLGWLIADEPLTGSTLVAGAIIVLAVALIVTSTAKAAIHAPPAIATPKENAA